MHAVNTLSGRSRGEGRAKAVLDKLVIILSGTQRSLASDLEKTQSPSDPLHAQDPVSPALLTSQRRDLALPSHE